MNQESLKISRIQEHSEQQILVVILVEDVSTFIRVILPGRFSGRLQV